MAIKNKRTSVANSVEKRLKSKLKEDFDNFLQEDDEEDMDALPGDDSDEVSGLEADPTETDDENPDEIQLTPTQEEWMDTEVDELLGANLEGQEDELSLDEGDDSLMEDEFDGEDFDVEDSAGDIDTDITGDEGDDLGGEELPGDFSAEELNAIIDSPNTIDVLKTELSQNALEAVPDEDGIGDDDDLGMGGDDDIDLDESEDLMEAELADSLEDIGYEQGGQGSGGAIKDYDKFGGDLDFEPVRNKGKATQGTAQMKKAGWETGKLPDGDNITDMVKESVKKSKMLVRAAEVISKLEEAYKKLKTENLKLSKVNGIFAAVGETLNKNTRKRISEKFDRCKDAKEVEALYKQIAKAVTAKKEPTLNEAIKRKTSAPVKTVQTSRLNENKSQPKVENISDAQRRKNFLMGIPGNDDAYFDFGQ